MDEMSDELKLLHSIVNKAAEHKNSLVKGRFEKAEKYFHGRQTRFTSKRTEMDSWKADTKTNLIYAHYLTSLAVLMRDIPIVTANAKDDIHEQVARQVTNNIADIFRSNSFPEREEEVLFSQFTYGKGFWKLTWDARANRGIGAMRLDSVSAKNMYPQPGKLRREDWLYVAQCDYMDQLTLYSMYPDLKDEIKSLYAYDKDKPAVTGDPYGNPPTEATLASGTGLTIYYDAMNGEPSKVMLPVWELYMTDDSMVDRFGYLYESDGGKVYVAKRKRLYKEYPTGRMVRFCGNVKLEDRPNPFPSFPYVESVNMFVEHEWSMGEWDQLESIQDLYDLRNNQIADGVNMAVGGDKVIYGPSSGIDPDEISNDPSERWIPGADPSQTKNIPAPQIPNAAFTSLDGHKSDFDRVSGFPETVLGGNMGDLRSGYAIEQLNEMVQGRLKLKTYSLECSIREIAKLATRYMGLFYTPGLHYPLDDNIQGVHPELFDYTVRAGLNLPASRRSQEQYLLQLLDRNVIDQQYLVEQSDIPNKEALMERMIPLWEAQKQMSVTPPNQGGGGEANLQVV